MIYIGIDNGVTGSIGIINDNSALCYPMPIKHEQSYTKSVKKISRINTVTLTQLLKLYMPCKVLIERPFTNPGRMMAMLSAFRSMEATLIVLEYLALPYEYIDSKEWQRAILPKGIWKLKEKTIINKKTGKETVKQSYKAESSELKQAAVDIARRLFPSVKCEDADGLLIAEYLRRRETGRV